MTNLDRRKCNDGTCPNIINVCNKLKREREIIDEKFVQIGATRMEKHNELNIRFGDMQSYINARVSFIGIILVCFLGIFGRMFYTSLSYADDLKKTLTNDKLMSQKISVEQNQSLLYLKQDQLDQKRINEQILNALNEIKQGIVEIQTKDSIYHKKGS